MAPAIKQMEQIKDTQRQVRVDEYANMSPAERLNVAQSQEGVPITKEQEVFLRETSLPPTDIEVNTANDILKEISSKYITPEGKKSSAWAKDYNKNIYKSINSIAEDMDSFQKARISPELAKEQMKDSVNFTNIKTAKHMPCREIRIA